MKRSRLLSTPLSNRRVVALLVCALLWRVLVDRHHDEPVVVYQAFWSLIISAISLVGGWLGTASSAVSAALTATVSWLAGSLGWLTTHVASIFRATGAMFSKVWDVSRRFWGDVIRPVFRHVYDWIKQARDWLKQKLGPAFKLIAKVRDRVRKIYDHWVRPILDGIETTRHVLQVLAKLHIKWAEKLDSKLGEVESIITENYLRILSTINRVTDVLNSIVDGSLLFQRIPFLASLRRDVPYWVRMFWNSQVIGLTASTRARLASRTVALADPHYAATQLAAFYIRRDGELAPAIQEAVPLWRVGLGLETAKDQS